MIEIRIYDLLVRLHPRRQSAFEFPNGRNLGLGTQLGFLQNGI